MISVKNNYVTPDPDWSVNAMGTSILDATRQARIRRTAIPRSFHFYSRFYVESQRKGTIIENSPPFNCGLHWSYQCKQR